MHVALVRIATCIALALSIVTPMTASADELSPAMMTSLTSGTKVYFKALGALDYTTLKSMTTPDFVITKDGKPLGPKLAGQIQTAKLYLNGVSSTVKVDSASMSGDTVTSNVSIVVSGSSFGGGGDNGGSSMSSRKLRQKHVMTWTKNAAGKWLLSKDAVISSKTSSM